MTTAEFGGVRGNAMGESGIDALLRRQGWGVLSLATDGEAYGVPVSFGYDGTNLYFVYLGVDEESQKEWYSERTVRASFLTVEIGSKHDWESAIVAGPLDRVEEAEWASVLEAVDDNAWFPDYFSEADPRRDLVGWRLRIESASGRRSTPG
jgi:hypothetical protein